MIFHFDCDLLTSFATISTTRPLFANKIWNISNDHKIFMTVSLFTQEVAHLGYYQEQFFILLLCHFTLQRGVSALDELLR
jgi:hypothetical protein